MKEKTENCRLETKPFYQCCCKCVFQREPEECHVFIEIDNPPGEVSKIEGGHSIGCEMYERKGD